MKVPLGLVILALVPLDVAAQTGAGSGTATATANAQQVATILANQCVSCHGPEQKKGGLDLSRRATALLGGKSGKVIVPGEPDLSLLVDKVTEGEMPPKGGLGREQIEAVRAWVVAGAPYASEPLAPRRAGADWWSLRPVRAVVPPQFSGPDAAWVRTPVDAFILARLKARGLRPAPPAGRAALIRRLTFDLIGLPPTPEAVDAFVADRDPRAYDALVDRLLASPRYGERWGRHWLDVVRFGESQGYETNLPRPAAWPYRDYVIRAFNRDTPFARFVLEQLAGDTLGRGDGRGASADPTRGHEARAGSDWLTQAATGFLVGGTHDIVGNQTIEGKLQQRADDLDDMITATGTTFLGLTIQCARCHDHKFDPITQKDYYGFQAIFAGVDHAEREVSAPDSEERSREAAALNDELASIDQRLDAREPLAEPGRNTPARPMVNARRNVERFAPVKARMIRLTILATGDRTEPCLDEVEAFAAAAPGGLPPRNVALATAGGTASASSEYPNAAIHKIAHLNDGRTGNSQSWISRVPGKGSITIAWPEPMTIDRVVWGRDREEVYRDRLPTEYQLEVALEPSRWQVVASSRDRAPYVPKATVLAAGPAPGPVTAAAGERADLIARQTERSALMTRQAAVRARLARLGATVRVYAGTFSQPGMTHLLVRGDPTRNGPEVRPSGVAVVVPGLVLDPQAPEARRRAALARWIADPANPLPARVMVNRVWQNHFTRGIVTTPSDFGFNGAPPSHPELLDWLASTYVAGGWRLKPIHRLIVTSAAYRQSSRLDGHADNLDRDNRLVWRVSPRRLEAESIRDAILAASGRLDSRMGGPGYNIWEKNTNYVAVYKPRDELGPDAFRRMVYQFKPRSQPDPTFGAFDCPDATLVAPRRNVSTTALQALNLLNSRFVIQQAAFFADRLKAEAGPDPARQADRGFRLAFGRPPSPTERAAAVALIGSHGAPAFCRALYNANEFVYVP
ncbi:MAG: PSD1 and planctomycete cytochrome C domain-containing protein [Isosphaerales bacterium]